MRFQHALDLRYARQAFELTVDLPDGVRTPAELRKNFLEAYARHYGRADPEGEIEVVNLRTTSVGVTGKPVFPAVRGTAQRIADAVTARRTLIVDGAALEAAVYERDRLPVEVAFDGPAIQAEANREMLIIPLIEDPATVQDFEALAAMEGLDVFFLGPFDFSVAAGVPGAGFDHPVMAKALERMVSIARRHGKYIMTSVGDRIDTAVGRNVIRLGVRMISYSADALVFRRACQEIARLKTPG